MWMLCRHGFVVFGVVLVAAYAGIWSRSGLPLASFWPANAILLGTLVRWPSLRNGASAIGAVGGFVVADMTTGGALVNTVWLTGGNLFGVAVGLLVLIQLPRMDQLLRRPLAVLLMLFACLAAAVGAAAVGAYIGPLLFEMSATNGAKTWFSSELAGYLALVPVVLSVPDRRWIVGVWSNWRRSTDRLPARVVVAAAAPWALVAVSLVIGVVVGGPAALTISLPPLVWVALRGNVFETAVLTLVAMAWTILALGFGHLDIGVDFDSFATSSRDSLQISLSLMATGPLMVAANASARDRALRAMSDLAVRDELTRLLTRRAFQNDASRTLASLKRTGGDGAVLMLDIDRFKALNDRLGHPVGDQVLRAVAGAISGSLRETDPLGRVGGEEFAAVVPGLSRAGAVRLGEQIRREVESVVVDVDGVTVGATVSIGVAHTTSIQGSAAYDLSRLLGEADRVLYLSKQNGRNRVTVVSDAAACDEAEG